MIAKYKKSDPNVDTIKKLSEKLVKKSFFGEISNSRPVSPCVISNQIYLGNNYFAKADGYTDEEKLLICMGCYYIRNAAYPKHFDIFLTLIQIRIFCDLSNISKNGVDEVLALL
jgi:hypothetical protein